MGARPCRICRAGPASTWKCGRPSLAVKEIPVQQRYGDDYADEDFTLLIPANRRCTGTSVFTRRGVERIVRFAFELAVTRNKKKRVTSITKSNAQGFSMVLWDRTFRDVRSEER